MQGQTHGFGAAEDQQYTLPIAAGTKSSSEAVSAKTQPHKRERKVRNCWLERVGRSARFGQSPLKRHGNREAKPTSSDDCEL
ncbi:hypothetical protein PSAC2689_80278 [Paraburkholderia sacchari]